MNIKKYFLKDGFNISVYFFVRAFVKQYNFNLLKFFINLKWYLNDLIIYVSDNDFNKQNNKIISLMPYLSDKKVSHSVDPEYYIQDAWAAQKIFQIYPKVHYDIGSNIKAMSIISQFIPVVFVDIRKVPIDIEGLKFRQGSILDLPFKPSSLKSISSICVIEHIGLGRYGDMLDPLGSEKAVKEIIRVSKKGADILVTVPVYKTNGVYFNAHRVFTRKYFLGLFNNCTLVEEKYIYGTKVFTKYSPEKGVGTGLYHLRRL